MPGNYKRTSTRKSWSQEDMAKAIEAVKENRMGWLLASKHFNVPQATLRRHYNSIPENLGRFKPTFSAEMERSLVAHVLEFERRLFGFNTTEIRKLAFEFAERLGLDHRFDKNEKIAGWDWLKGFRERNPNISLRAPEPTSAARTRAFNKPQVMRFFSLLEKTVTDNGIPAHRIYNMDESGLNTVQKPPKVFASKGKKQVGAVTSAERGKHFTVVACANAIGNFVPPALIIPRKNHKAEYFDGAPPGTLELCYPTGYMVGDLFLKWMRHFVAFVNASVTNKVLLILDGHSSHKNLEALEFAKSNGVIMLCLPPHCTHRMQPTDVSFFGPLQAYYDCEMATWMKNHPGRTIGLYKVAQIFGRAYENAASVRNITSGFEKSGIFPFNPNIFPEDMYLPSEVTENELNNDDGPIASSSRQLQLNHEESDSLESTDAGEQMDVAAANSSREVECRQSSPTILIARSSRQPQLSHEESDSSESTDAGEQMDVAVANSSREVESRHSSPTILSENVIAHLPQDHDANILSVSRPMLLVSGSVQPTTTNEQMDVIRAPKTGGTSREPESPSSLKTLSENVVRHLLQDHDVNISSRSKPMLLKSGPKKSTNATEQMDVTTAPVNNHQEQIADFTVPEAVCVEGQKPTSVNQPSHANEHINIASVPDTNYQEQIADATLLETISEYDDELPSGSNQILTGEVLLPTTKSILKEISPLPKAASTGKTRVNRKVGGSQVLTASPFMNDIKAAVQKKKEEENRKALKKQTQDENRKPLKKQKQTKRVIFEDDGVKPGPAPKKQKQTERVIIEDDGVEPGPAPKKRRTTRGRKQTKRFILDDDEDLEEVKDPYANEDEEESDPPCIYCNELFSQSRPKEHWVKCQVCSKWCHTICGGVSAKTKQFTCELCK